jgi:hypothetical protein
MNTKPWGSPMIPGSTKPGNDHILAPDPGERFVNFDE